MLLHAVLYEAIECIFQSPNVLCIQAFIKCGIIKKLFIF